jgi:hypothetical protein
VHPKTTVLMTLQPSMGWPFLWCSLAFMGLFVLLLTARVALEHRRADLEDLYLAVED